MINSIHGSRRGAGARRSLTALALAVGLLVVLSLPGAASAADVQCGGTIKAGEVDEFSDNPLVYRFKCSAEIVGYSIVSTRQVDYFSPEVIGLLPDGNGSGEVFGCEGTFPGAGFGCKGKLAAGHIVEGDFSLSEPLCSTRLHAPRARFWLVTASVQLDAKGNPFTTSSQPYPLAATKCPKVKAAKKSGKKIAEKHGKAKSAKTKS